MADKREEIKRRIRERAAARRKEIVRPKPARPMNQQHQQRLQAKRQSLKARQEAIRRKMQAQAARRTAAATLAAETRERLEEVQRELDGLQDDIMLTSVHDDMGEIESILTNLATDLENLRTRGYAFGSFLENKLNVLTGKWEDVTEQIEDEIEAQSDKLEQESEEAEQLLRQAFGGNQAMVSRAESAVSTLASKASSARSALQNRYNDIERTIYQTRRQLDDIKWAFEQAEQSTFEFLDAEYLIAACKAKLLDKPHEDDDEGAEGILYITDERIIFEQKEKIATKKFLFVTTESEMVQEVDFEVLIDWLEGVEAQDKKKFMSRKELLTLNLSPEAVWHTVTFRLLDGAKNEAWSQLINRVKSDEIERERIAEAAEEKEEAITQTAEAPTDCGVCGAPLPTSVVRGQDVITCEYCGSSIRL